LISLVNLGWSAIAGWILPDTIPAISKNAENLGYDQQNVGDLE
jgi:hypothetical protein